MDKAARIAGALCVALLLTTNASKAGEVTPGNPDIVRGSLNRCISVKGETVFTGAGTDGFHDCRRLSDYIAPSDRPGLQGYIVLSDDPVIAVLHYAKRFKVSGVTRSSWLMLSYPTPQAMSGTTKTYTRAVAKWTVNCSTNHYSISEGLLQSIDNGELVTVSQNGKRPDRESVPDTVSEQVVELLCALPRP